MIDLHSHILHGVDDGPAIIEESLAILEAMSSLGYRHVVLTPHVREELWPYSAELPQARFEELVEAARGSVPGIDLSLGAEYHYQGTLFEQAGKNVARTLGSSRVLLVELPEQVAPPRLEEGLFRLRLAGYEPLIAHPERHHYLFRDRLGRLEKLVDSGTMFQVSLSSLAGKFGGRIRRRARTLLKKGIARVVASDVHHLDEVDMHVVPALDHVRKLAGEEGARQLLVLEPARIMEP